MEVYVMYWLIDIVLIALIGIYEHKMKKTI